MRYAYLGLGHTVHRVKPYEPNLSGDELVSRCGYRDIRSRWQAANAVVTCVTCNTANRLWQQEFDTWPDEPE